MRKLLYFTLCLLIPSLVLEGQTVTTIAGTGTAGYLDGPGASAMFDLPIGLALNNQGELFVSDAFNHRIRKIDNSGNVSTFAGSGNPGSVDGQGQNASFNRPHGMTFGSNGTLYVSDLLNYQLRTIDQNANVQVYAGTGSSGFSNGSLANASFNYLSLMVFDAAGNLFLADRFNNAIRKIDTSGQVTTFAGGIAGFIDDTGTLAKFFRPFGICIDNNDNLYVADRDNHAIRKITPLGVVTTIAGNGNQGYMDGADSIATFNRPSGVAVDNAGNLYVADNDNYVIRKITPNGNVSTFAGSGVQGSNDGVALSASLGGPTSIIYDGNITLYFVDADNNMIRKTEGGILPIVDLGPDTMVCRQDSLLLDAGYPNYNYLWSTGDTTQTIIVDSSGEYWVEVSYDTSSAVRDSINVTVIEIPVADFSYLNTGFLYNFMNQSLNADSFYWDFGDGNQDSVPDPDHTYSGPGTYVVMLAVSNFCGTDTMYQTIVIEETTIPAVQITQLRLFPNPVEDFLYLEDIAERFDVRIIDPLGRVVYVDFFLSGSRTSIDMGSLGSGLYAVQVITGNSSKTRLILKR